MTMPKRVNRQSRNVGNLGDIMKHAALVELASMFAKSSSQVSYVETHSFLLHAPLSDREKWEREVNGLVSKHPAYARYTAFEQQSLARKDRYRCSSGLVMDVLGEARVSAVLGEANGITRAELSEQIRQEHLTNVLVVDDAAAIDRDARAQPGAALLVHVDPFSLTPELWKSIAPALDAISARSTEAALVVYRYTRNAPSPWPTAPAAMLGPVAQTRAGPHEMAAYASPASVIAVSEVCQALGWRLGST
jgi:23S rRNA A2030 N6-methylase RlmJ